MAPTDALEEYEIHLDVCWQTVADYICQDLLRGEQTTYTECCCRLGEAWGQNCALCPHRSSGEQGGVGRLGCCRLCWAGLAMCGCSEGSSCLHGQSQSPTSLWLSCTSGRMYLNLVCSELEVSKEGVALCVLLLLLCSGGVRQWQPGMGAHWELGCSLLKDLLAPDKS